MEHLVTLGLVFLNLFMLVGTVDLFYYHIWKYRLHTRPESRYEHKLHMAFALIMVPLAYLLYYQDLGGYGLWAAAFFVVAALAIKFFIRYLKLNGFRVFGIYRVVAGIILIILLLTGVIES